MALTETDRDWIKDIAREVSREIVAETTKAHIIACPHGQGIGRLKAIAIGIGIGLAIGGGASGFAIGKAFALGF